MHEVLSLESRSTLEQREKLACPLSLGEETLCQKISAIFLSENGLNLNLSLSCGVLRSGTSKAQQCHAHWSFTGGVGKPGISTRPVQGIHDEKYQKDLIRTVHHLYVT